jgi:CheY-like chemotaxis protein
MMPNMDGEETLIALRRIQQDVKIVLSSGYNEQDVAKRLAGTGFAGILKKPYTADTLIGKLRQVLEENG